MAEPIETEPPLGLGTPLIESVSDISPREGKREDDFILEVIQRFAVYPFALEGWDKRREVLEWAEENLPWDIKNCERGLEVGCAGGKDVMDCVLERDYNCQIQGLDINPNFFYISEDKAQNEGIDNVGFITGRVEDLSDIEDESLDFVMAWYMMYETEDPAKALAEIWKKLKPGGVLLLTTHGKYNIPTHRDLEILISEATEGKYKNPKPRSRNFTVEIAEELLANQGFEELKTFHTKCPIEIPAEHKQVYRDSINTRWTEFKDESGGMPSRKLWNKLMVAIVDRYIERKIKENDYITDFMDRWGGVYQKPPVEAPSRIERLKKLGSRLVEDIAKRFEPVMEEDYYRKFEP